MNRSDYKLRQRENLLSNSAKRLPSPPSILVPYVRSQLLSLCYNDLPSALLKPNECFSAIHIPASTQKFYLRKWNIFLSIFRVPLWCGGCEIFSKMKKKEKWHEWHHCCSADSFKMQKVLFQASAPERRQKKRCIIQVRQI